MFRTLRVVIFCPVIFCIMYSSCTHTNTNDHGYVNVLFPLSLLRKDESLISPTNTESTHEYYLLENLGVGLIRDDLNCPSGFCPALSLNWEQVDPYNWKFKLRENLRWSDGSPIHGQQIVNHLEGLKTSGSRHINVLGHLESTTFDQDDLLLHLKFNKPTGDEILHELSLADAVLTHPKHLSKDWKVTSGPYFVESYDPDKKELNLKLNEYCPIVQKDSPKGIRLFALKSKEEFPKIFREYETDLFYMPFPTFDPQYKVFLENADFVYEGYPTYIYYFQFNPGHPLFPNLRLRKEFFSLVNRFFKEQPLKRILHEDQMVPLGFKGRLENYKLEEILEASQLQGKTIKIGIPESFEGVLEKTSENLKLFFGMHGVILEIEYTDLFKNPEPDSKIFATTRLFQGNQRNVLSSFSFLFSKGAGPLSAFHDDYQKLLGSYFGGVNDEKKEGLLQEFHKKILEDAFSVPFAVESGKILTSNRIDVSKWDRFDLRSRYYLLKWK